MESEHSMIVRMRLLNSSGTDRRQAKAGSIAASSVLNSHTAAYRACRTRVSTLRLFGIVEAVCRHASLAEPSDQVVQSEFVSSIAL